MIEIEARCCEGSLEAKRIERGRERGRKHIEQLNADLNATKRPSISSEEKLSKDKSGVLKTQQD